VQAASGFEAVKAVAVAEVKHKRLREVFARQSSCILRHEIIVQTPEFQAKAALEIRPKLDIFDYHPKQIYQQERQDVFISLTASQPFGTCHTKL